MRKLKNSELGRVGIEGFKQQDKLPVVLILDNIRSLNNVGSIFRTSDAFALEALYLCGITGTPPHREIEKTAIGSTQSVDWFYEPDTLQLVQKLKSQGYQIISIEQVENSKNLSEFTFDNEQKYAFIFGNEIDGVDQKVIEASHACIEIPQFGTKHSFNITVSAGIVLWDYFSKSGTQKKS